MLQQLFTSPILSIRALHPGYEDHASDVFLIQTADAEVIVRSSKMNEEPNNDFGGDAKISLELIKERTSFRNGTCIAAKTYKSSYPNNFRKTYFRWPRIHCG